MSCHLHLGSRHGTAQLPGGYHRGASLLHSWHELSLQPGLVNTHWSTIDHCLGGVRKLCGGVVAPDGHLLDGSDGLTQLGRQLSRGAVLVEPGHGGEVVLGYCWSVVTADQSVGVSGVTNNKNLVKVKMI